MIALDRLRERVARDVAEERVARAAEVRAVPRLRYAWGNQREFSFDYETCRGRATLLYQLGDGRMVELDLVSTDPEIAEAYEHWRSL